MIYADFQHSILINRPVEAVYTAVADVKTHPRWQEGLHRSEGVGSDQSRVGARGVEVRKMLEREIHFPYEITVYDPPYAWGFRALAGPIRPSAVLSFRPYEGGTQIESKLTVPGLPGFVLGRMMLAQQRRDYHRLKELLETGAL